MVLGYRVTYEYEYHYCLSADTNNWLGTYSIVLPVNYHVLLYYCTLFHAYSRNKWQFPYSLIGGFSMISLFFFFRSVAIHYGLALLFFYTPEYPWDSSTSSK